MLISFFRCWFPFFKYAYIFEALIVTSLGGPLSLLNWITCIWNLQWYAFKSVTCGCIPIWMLSFPVNLFNLLDSSLCQVTHFYYGSLDCWSLLNDNFRVNYSSAILWNHFLKVKLKQKQVGSIKENCACALHLLDWVIYKCLGSLLIESL